MPDLRFFKKYILPLLFNHTASASGIVSLIIFFAQLGNSLDSDKMNTDIINKQGSFRCRSDVTFLSKADLQRHMTE